MNDQTQVEATLKLNSNELEKQIQEYRDRLLRLNQQLDAEVLLRQKIELQLGQQTQRERLMGTMLMLMNSALERQIQERTVQLQQSLEFEAMLKRITDRVRDSLDEHEILQTAVQELGQVLGVKCCNAASYEHTQGTSIIRYEYTTLEYSDQGKVMRMDNFPEIYEQLLSGRHLQFCSLNPHPMRGRVAMLACPILDGQNVLGDLWLINDSDYQFSELELRLLQQVSNQCAIAIRQARLYQEARLQVAELGKLNQLKDDFLSTISHELRTPISNMTMAVRMLTVAFEQFLQTETTQNSSQRGKIARYLQILQNECERESNLIKDLLDLQELEATEPPALVLAAIPLETWLPQVVDSFQSRMQERQQQLELAIQPDLPAFISDHTTLSRIMSELLNNAYKYTPSGERIEVAVHHREGKIRFQVTNSGSEIPLNEQERIFQKFYRIPNADPWKQGGTGLGLALVQRLVRNLEGVIQVQSAANQTCFTIDFPLRH